MRIRLVLIAGWLALALPGIASADQKDPVLPELFKQLAVADSPSIARVLEGQIWEVWSDTTNQKARLPFSVGVNFMQEGNLEAARESFTEAIAADPEFAEAYNKRATVLYYEGKYEASVADIQRTLVLEPRHFGALSGLAMITRGMGREEVALQVLTRTKEIYPAMPGLEERIHLLEDAIGRKRI